MNIIVHEICEQYCLKYNKVYDMNFIKPLWYMIFEFAADPYSADILLFMDYHSCFKTDGNHDDDKIKQSLLQITDISYQKLTSKELIQMVKNGQLFKDYKYKPNKYYKTFITLIFDVLTTIDNHVKYIFEYRSNGEKYSYIFVQIPRTNTAYGYNVSQYQTIVDE